MRHSSKSACYALLLRRDENSDSGIAETALLWVRVIGTRMWKAYDVMELGMSRCVVCEALRLRAQSQRRREMTRSVRARKAGDSGSSFRIERKRMQLSLGLSRYRKAGHAGSIARRKTLKNSMGLGI